jgi:multiple sugar transport system substrate-binding protein
MKKVLTLVLMGAFTLAMSGCVKIDDTPYEVDCEQFPTHPDCITDINPDNPEGPGLVNVLDEFPTEDVTITFWHVYGASKSALLDEMIAEFEELHPNVTIDSLSQGNYQDIRDFTKNAIASGGELPTIVIGYPDHVAEYLKGDAVIPLDDFIKSEKWGIDLNDFITSYVEENTQYKNGLMYSFPYSKSTEMMVYNKDIIEANSAAITAALGEPFPENRPLTWAELDLLSDILVDPNWDSNNPTPNKCGFLINYDSPGNFFINNVRMWQGGYTDSDGNILIQDPNTTSMLEYVGQRFNDHTMVVPVEWSASYGSEFFINGDVCMSVGSTAGINYNIPSDGSFEVGVAPIPQYDVNHMSAVQQGPNISIMKKSTDAQRLVAWEFIKYLINSENTAKWAMDTGYLPVRYSGYESDIYQDFLQINDMTNSKYYFSKAAQAAALQRDYFEYDPAFAGAYTSSDARDASEIAINALYAMMALNDTPNIPASVTAVIDDMLSSLNAN